MKKQFLTISAGFLLLFAAIYFFDDSGFLAALIPAVLVHEAGHALCLYACGARVDRIRLDLTGACISYTGGHMSLLQELAAAFAGPFWGLAYALAASWAAGRTNSDILGLSAGISLVLSGFNLLPALPLDGGRALYLILCRLYGRRKANKVQYILGLTISLAAIVAGLWCLGNGFGAALILSGFWLLMAASEDACKMRGFVIQ